MFVLPETIELICNSAHSLSMSQLLSLHIMDGKPIIYMSLWVLNIQNDHWSSNVTNNSKAVILFDFYKIFWFRSHQMKKVKQKFMSKFYQFNFQMIPLNILRRRKREEVKVESGHNVHLTAYLHCSWTTTTLCLDKTLHSSDNVC